MLGLFLDDSVDYASFFFCLPCSNKNDVVHSTSIRKLNKLNLKHFLFAHRPTDRWRKYNMNNNFFFLKICFTLMCKLMGCLLRFFVVGLCLLSGYFYGSIHLLHLKRIEWHTIWKFITTATTKCINITNSNQMSENKPQKCFNVNKYTQTHGAVRQQPHKTKNSMNIFFFYFWFFLCVPYLLCVCVSSSICWNCQFTSAVWYCRICVLFVNCARSSITLHNK